MAWLAHAWARILVDLPPDHAVHVCVLRIGILRLTQRSMVLATAVAVDE